MKTVTIQIGNSDDKLTQAQWRLFVLDVQAKVLQNSQAIHFFGAPSNWERWQNAAWIVVCEDDKLQALKNAIADIRKCFNQDSVAWTEGDTQFV